VDRHLALALNVVLPGAGLLLRHAGWWPVVVALIGTVGLSLVVVAFVSPGSATIALVGWAGLTLWAAAVVVAVGTWAMLERPSSRDLTAIQPLFREVAKAYLTGDLAVAEQSARRLVRLAGAEAGAWRLLALVIRAQGRPREATRYDRRALRLELAES
jgi:hypothetical protein